MWVSSCTRAACRASAVHDAAEGGIITIDDNNPATCGLPSLKDCRTATGRFSPSRCPIARASLVQLSGAGLDPLQTDRPLRTQQKENQTRTPRVPMVPTVPRVPRVWFQVVSDVPGSTVDVAVGTSGTVGTPRNTTLGTSGILGTIGTLIPLAMMAGASKTKMMARCQT